MNRSLSSLRISDSLNIAPDSRPAPARPTKRLILQRVIDSPFLTPAQKGVYIGICHYVGTGGYADVSHDRLAQDLNLSRNTVRNCVSKLKKIRVITVVVRPGTRNIYYPIL